MPDTIIPDVKPAVDPVVPVPIVVPPTVVPQVKQISMEIGGVLVPADFSGMKIVNGIPYHDVHLVDGTQYLLNDDDFKSWCS